MNDTLWEGDYTLISKIPYGPRLPRSSFEIPWINLLAYQLSSAETRKKLLTDNRPYQRLASFSRVRKDDVIAFNLPPYQKSHIIKRATGGPGEYVNISIRASKSDSCIQLPSINLRMNLNEVHPIYRNSLEIYNKGSQDGRYVYDSNYYFVTGDNRDNSIDSRSWGFLQEDHIIGKAVCILISFDQQGKIRWNRCFKIIR